MTPAEHKARNRAAKIKRGECVDCPLPANQGQRCETHARAANERRKRWRLQAGAHRMCTREGCKHFATDGDYCGYHNPDKAPLAPHKCIRCGSDELPTRNAKLCNDCKRTTAPMESERLRAQMSIAADKIRAALVAKVRRIDPAEHQRWLAAQGRTR